MQKEGGGRRGGIYDYLYDQKLAALHGAWRIRFDYEPQGLIPLI